MSRQIAIPVTDVIANPESVKKPMADPLTTDQRARVEMLHVAREVLGGRGPFSPNSLSQGTIDLITVAQWVETGDFPFEEADE